VGPRAVLDAEVKRKIPSPRWESNCRTPIVQSVARRTCYKSNTLANIVFSVIVLTQFPQYLLTYLFTYLLTYLLTPWCRTLFENMIVTQLVKKYPAFVWNSKVQYRVHTVIGPYPEPDASNPLFPTLFA